MSSATPTTPSAAQTIIDTVTRHLIIDRAWENLARNQTTVSAVTEPLRQPQDAVKDFEAGKMSEEDFIRSIPDVIETWLWNTFKNGLLPVTYVDLGAPVSSDRGVRPMTISCPTISNVIDIDSGGSPQGALQLVLNAFQKGSILGLLTAHGEMVDTKHPVQQKENLAALDSVGPSVKLAHLDACTQLAILLVEHTSQAQESINSFLKGDPHDAVKVWNSFKHERKRPAPEDTTLPSSIKITNKVSTEGQHLPFTLGDIEERIAHREEKMRKQIEYLQPDYSASQVQETIDSLVKEASTQIKLKEWSVTRIKERHPGEATEQLKGVDLLRTFWDPKTSSKDYIDFQHLTFQEYPMDINPLFPQRLAARLSDDVGNKRSRILASKLAKLFCCTTKDPEDEEPLPMARPARLPAQPAHTESEKRDWERQAEETDAESSMGEKAADAQSFV